MSTQLDADRRLFHWDGSNLNALFPTFHNFSSAVEPLGTFSLFSSTN